MVKSVVNFFDFSASTGRGASAGDEASIGLLATNHTIGRALVANIGRLYGAERVYCRPKGGTASMGRAPWSREREPWA